MTLTRIATTAALALLATTALTACGGGTDLTDNDMQVCFYAHDRETDRVYEHAPDADTTDIIDLAAPIQFGSSEAADESAMRGIQSYCEDNGYDYDKDGRFGEGSTREQ